MGDIHLPDLSFAEGFLRWILVGVLFLVLLFSDEISKFFHKSMEPAEVPLTPAQHVQNCAECVKNHFVPLMKADSRFDRLEIELKDLHRRFEELRDVLKAHITEEGVLFDQLLEEIRRIG